MEADEVIAYLRAQYDDVVRTEAWGEVGVYYNPNRTLPSGVYFVTVKSSDGPNDSASNLDRDGVYRVNLGISEDTFTSLFGEIPDRPAKGETVTTGHDFSELDSIVPHPTYGWTCWISVLNPSDETFERSKPLFDEAYARARARFSERTK